METSSFGSFVKEKKNQSFFDEIYIENKGFLMFLFDTCFQ